MDAGLLILRIVLGVLFVCHSLPKLVPGSDRGPARMVEAILGPGFSRFWRSGRPGTTRHFKSLGVPLPAVSAVVAGATQALGAVTVLIGWQARLGALLLATNMAVAAVVRRDGGLIGGFEYPLLLMACSLTILLAGPGRYAVG